MKKGVILPSESKKGGSETKRSNPIVKEREMESKRKGMVWIPQ